LSGVFLASQQFAKDHNLKKEALGTGPYELVSFKPDSEVVLKARPSYYGGNAAYQNVRFVLASDSAAKVNGLKAGEIDVANIINPNDFNQLEASGNLVVGAIPSARVMLLAVNATKKPLDDKRVREAISLAIDREAITKFVFRGLVGSAHDQNISDVYDAYNEALGPSEYNPEKAKQLLAEAGLANGFSVEYLTVQNSTIANEQTAELVAAQLGQIGIKVQLSIVPRSVGGERGSKPETAAGLTYSGFIDTAVVAAETLRYIGSTHNTVFTDVADGYDQAVADARAANSDEEKIAAIKRATQLAKDNQQAIFLWPLAQTFAHSKSVSWPIRSDDYLLPYTITPADKTN
jgi:peptide/nickel transport system substrate-binding protein